MPSKQTNCMYCGKEVTLVFEKGRPKAMQNGRLHQCSFSKLGLSSASLQLAQAETAGRGVSSRKDQAEKKWSFWAGLFS